MRNAISQKITLKNYVPLWFSEEIVVILHSGFGCWVLGVGGHLGTKKSLPMQGDLEGLTSLFLRFKSVASPFPVSEIHRVEKANKTKDEQK